MAKRGPVAAQKELRLIPAAFSHTGQIHEEFKIFAKEQIRAKFEYFEGQVKSSKMKSHMNWWVKCISAVIAKTASVFSILNFLFCSFNFAFSILALFAPR